MASNNEYRLFCGKIPADVSEREISELFGKFGNLHEVILKTDPLTKLNRGFAFVTFSDVVSRDSAIEALNGYAIRERHCLKVAPYTPNRSLYLGNISKSKDADRLRAEIKNHFAQVDDVIVYRSAENRLQQNRGFCFVRFESHEAALDAKQNISKNPVRYFGHPVYVDWADPIELPDDSIMNEVRVLYVRNLTPSVTEEQLTENFAAFGRIERVKKMKDFAFVHFERRSDAIAAMQSMHGTELDGETIGVTLSRPPINKRRKEEMLRAREQRLRAQAAG